VDALGIASPRLVDAQILSDARKGRPPAEVVRSLYRDYAWEASERPSAMRVPFQHEKTAVLRRYVTRELAAAIRADYQCVSDTKELCAISSSVLWGSQDPRADTVQVEAMRRPGMVGVQYTARGAPKPVVLMVSLTQTPDGWRVADIAYDRMRLRRILRLPVSR